MTLAELAKRINATVPDILENYKRIFIEIPQDENYILTVEEIKKVIPNYNPDEKNETAISKIDRQKLNLDRIDERKIQFEARRIKRIEILNNLELYFKKPDSALLNEFKRHNTIPNLVFEGDYRKIAGNDFGFFKNVTHQNGATLTYPVSNDLIDEIFIPSGELTNGIRYLFEATLARRNERTKKVNPFLLQAKSDNIQEILELSEISEELKDKKEELYKIKTYLKKAEEHLEERKTEIEEQVSQVLQQKLKEANKTLEHYNKNIEEKYNEIQNKEDVLTSLNESVEIANINLQHMENLLNTLKDRVSLCRNLQFISEDDEKKYLNLITAQEYRPINHLDFENDFEKNFSKLAEHIHAFLYHKKNLIYTRYQIRNFLTLLKTNDIIVLSGLSGSGKTQIVKAFAEALGGVAKIIPVKPNWTSSDDLIGYYNPLQMSFLPTPFTEAIVEATHNPNQLYFICLDEMNLARVEYYFADFLSKLEERSNQPEIELYANHEEELFVSEFTTLLNLIESSIKGKKIESWQGFLDDEEARKKFFELLGNIDKESMLQLHAKMKRRLIDILKFPSTIRIPGNIRFIGAINVDETTHYFSPKILDRFHIVKFENPLLFEQKVNGWFENLEFDKELKPVYVSPDLFSERKEYPKVNSEELRNLTQKIKDINEKYLLPLNIDFGVRSIRQSLNFAKELHSVFEYYYYSLEYGRTDIPDVRDYYDEENNLGRVETQDIALNSILIQKIFPRFVFDGSDIAKNGKTKLEVVEEFQKFLADEFNNLFYNYETDETSIGKLSSEYLEEMILQANRSNSQFNYFA